MATFGEALERARQLLGAGHLAEAGAIYRQLVEAVPQAADAWHELGIVHLQAGDGKAAVECLRQAVALDSKNPAYHGNLGAAYRLLKQPREALACFERALQLGPPTAELHNNLALCWKDAGQPDAALASFDRALALRPDYANGHFNRGNLLLELGRPAEAMASYRQAIRYKADDAGAHCKLGMAHFELGELDGALACFTEALAIRPNYPEARRNRGFVWLAQGNFDEGFPEFEWRTECEEFGNSQFNQPRWDGAPLDGRTLLVYAEQGLGDTLHFIRYLPLIDAPGGRVLLRAPPALWPLLTSSGFGRWLVEPGSEPQFDLQCPLVSLAGLIGGHRDRPYWQRPYLAADPALVARWADRLRVIEGFKVGIAWAGSAAYSHDRFRSVRLGQFAPLAAVRGVRLVSLQKGATAAEWAELPEHQRPVDFGDELDGHAGAFMDTAAIIEHLDLVISVDTAIGHLAGALGAKVWVVLARSPDWRWGQSGETTPWYPSMRLFRQREVNRWGEVFRRAAGELGKLVAP